MRPYDAILPAPMCPLGVCFSGDTLTRLDFLPVGSTVCASSPDARVRLLARELDAYWDSPTHSFDLPFAAQGTPFQLRVWNALSAIPVGHPTSYGALATRLGTAARAVGQACGGNPLPVLIPCHRVVAANGLGGFMHAATGAPLNVKVWLLNHEKNAQAPS